MSLKKQHLFTQKLANAYKGGYPVVEAITDMERRENRPSVKKKLLFLKDKIERGNHLADAMLESDWNIFDTTYCNLIKAGELSGKLDIVLEQLLTFQKQTFQFRRNLLLSLIYPCIIIGVYLMLVCIMFFLLIPAIASFMANFGACPPPLIGFLAQLAEGIGFLRTVTIFLSTIVLSVACWLIIINLDSIAMLRGLIAYHIPLVGSFVKTKALYTYTFILKVCYSAGLPMTKCLDVAKDAVENDYIYSLFSAHMEIIEKRRSLYEYLSATRLFPYDYLQTVDISEKSGTLEDAFTYILDKLNAKRTMLLAIIVGSAKPLGILFGVTVVGSIFTMVVLIIIQAFSTIQNALPSCGMGG